VALILEQLDLRRGTVAQRLVIAPGLVVGRAYDVALVLDDPHVDVRHAQVTVAVDGLALEDLGSVNGITLLNGEHTLSVALVPGARFHLGRTAFRVVDGDAGLPPAVPLPAAGAPRTTEFESAFATSSRWYDRRVVQLALILGLAVLFGVEMYLDDATRDAGTSGLGGGIAGLILIAMGAGVWALIARLVGRRARFLPQSAVISAAFLLTFIVSGFVSYLTFLLPAAGGFLSFGESALMTLLGVVTLYTQLGIATALSARRRAIGSAAGFAVIITIIAGFALVKDRGAFSDVPEFNGVVKLVPAAAIPATDIDGFRASLAELRQEVDSLKGRSDAQPQR
jgi:Ca2+/Na+ antiporter